MPKRDTQAFLRAMNAQNAAIAERQRQEAEQKKVRGDPVRIQYDKDRREKWGQLRAREHPGSRPITARHAFGRPKMF